MKTALFIIVAATIIVFGLIYLIGLPVTKGQEHEQGDTTQQTTPSNKYEAPAVGTIRRNAVRIGRFIHEYREDIVAVCTAFIAIFTIILAFATGFLYVATRDLVEEGKNSSEKQLRAYVGIHSMKTTVYPFEEGGFAFIAHAELRNYGQTPAYDFTVQANAILAESDAIPFDDSQGPAKSAGPSIAFRDAGIQVEQWRKISEQDKDAMLSQKKRVFFWGTARYKDAFGTQHKFTFRLISGQLVVGTSGVYAMAAHPMGYEGD